MAYGYVYPASAAMPSPMFWPTSASIGRPTPPTSGATIDTLDSTAASKDGDALLELPGRRTWSERKPCLIAALLGFALTGANCALGGLVEPDTLYSFRQASPLAFVGPFAYSANATRSDGVWRHVDAQPAVSFWLAANAICAPRARQ